MHSFCSSLPKQRHWTYFAERPKYIYLYILFDPNPSIWSISSFIRTIYRILEVTRNFIPMISGLKYTPTSVIFLKIPSISKSQWHPFSITSSSSVDKNSISIIIKCEGQWTSSLYNQIHAGKDSESDLRKCIPIATEGPYGPASLDFLRYRYDLQNILELLSVYLHINAATSSLFLDHWKLMQVWQSASSRWRNWANTIS